jgi:hypothetical protein
MKNIVLLIIGIILCSKISFSQQAAVDVTDQTIKIGINKEEILYFGFAEGDQIIFNFSEADGKELKEVEIVEYPSSSKFSDFKTAKIENKTINVSKKSIYKFRFFNGALTAGRVCKIKIQRIPASDATKNFNTGVSWITKQDTTWNTYTKDVIIRYDSTYAPETKKVLIRTDTTLETIKDNSVIKVHSTTDKSGNPNKTTISFQLPEGTQYWVYTISVGQDNKVAIDKTVTTLSETAKTVAAKLPLNQYSLGLYALGYVSDLVISKNGSNVQYKFLPNSTSANNFVSGVQYTYITGAGGDVISDYGKMFSPTSGTVFMGLLNDNTLNSIDVTVSIIAVKVTPVYEEKQEQKLTVTPITEKKIVKEPLINTSTVPMND